MATYYSWCEYTSNGEVKTFSIPFPYLQASDVRVYLNNVLQPSTAYVFPTPNTVTLLVQPPAGVIVKLQRVTTLAHRIINFQNSALITESDLDTNSDQLLYLMQETIDASGGLAALVTTAYLDVLRVACEAAETNAKAAEALAEEWAEKPVGQAVKTGKYSALHWADKAMDWAETPEDTEVETGKYSALHWAAKAQSCLSAAVPAGTVIDYAGATPPSGFLLCDGAAVSRATYSDLFNAIGVLWGVGDGSTTFNVPDFRDTFVVGAANGASPGATGGNNSLSLVSGNIPDHNHSITVSGGTHYHAINGVNIDASGHVVLGSNTTGFPFTQIGTIATNNIGQTGGGAHSHTVGSTALPTVTPIDNRPKYGACLKLIKT